MKMLDFNPFRRVQAI